MSTIATRLEELNIRLPRLAPASGTYVPHRRVGSLLFVSGQVPRVDGVDAFIGVVGDTMTLEEGYDAARAAGINLIARVALALDGDLDRVASCVQLRGFVNAVPGFQKHPAVIDGASDLLVAVFGEKGQHCRTALGAGSLPRGFAVEIDAIFEVEG
ncbi:RidA family protein [Aureimonas sp. ME7]|uniref:RidA family protein n=1 Tax=Aureimonas sp. ME7 TaxID=2744252 RepID=UPI0015F84453|nr:RidA family protein [Aureimonas sp. ME7]